MSIRRLPLRIAFLAIAVAVIVGVGGGAARAVTSVGDVNWLSFGNTANENRYSPLTLINSSNIGQLGRAFTVDLNQFVPGIKKGQQDYPIVVNGTMYVTSGDDQVFAVNATTGALLWHYAPDNIATFKNFGIVANRGVAYCDNRIFLLTLDMTIVALDPQTGQQPRPRADRPGGSRRARKLRLLRDLGADLCRQPPDRRGRRLRVRRPRLRHGLQHP